MEQTLADIALLLDRFNEPVWEQICRDHEATYGAATDPRFRLDAARAVLQLLRRGIGSFSDIVLQPGGRVAHEQTTLEAVRKRLFAEALVEA